jgi:hypothetical protein
MSCRFVSGHTLENTINIKPSILKIAYIPILEVTWLVFLS